MAATINTAATIENSARRIRQIFIESANHTGARPRWRQTFTESAPSVPEANSIKAGVLQQPERKGVPRQPRYFMDAELFHDVLAVVINCFDRPAQLTGDPFIA